MSDPIAKLDVSRATAAEAKVALELVWQGLSPAERQVRVAGTLADALLAPDGLSGLLVARRDGEIVGAVWAEQLPGRTAMVTPPQLLDAEPVSTAGPLLKALLHNLLAWRVSLAQIILDVNDAATFELARSAGFVHGTDLLYMVSMAGTFPKEFLPNELQLEAFDPSGQSRLAKVIEQTYVGTRDCEWLGGVRQIDDVLAGHRAVGVFKPEHWSYLRHEGRDVGCLLLAEHPAQHRWELVYLGLVPEARGRGWGLAAVRHAQFQVRRAHGERVQLIVDVDNAPAIATYASAGFVVWDRRSVLMHFFRRDGL